MVLEMTVVGNIGNDCTISNVQGKNCINFNVAHGESYKDANGVKVEKSTWISCAYWVENTAISPYLKKGTLVYVKGKPEATAYQDKQGKWVAQLRLRVFEVRLLSASKEISQPQQSTQTTTPQGNGAKINYGNNNVEPTDDLPF